MLRRIDTMLKDKPIVMHVLDSTSSLEGPQNRYRCILEVMAKAGEVQN
jgi:hypothetical protein